jgi:hypothetical protein
VHTHRSGWPSSKAKYTLVDARTFSRPPDACLVGATLCDIVKPVLTLIYARRLWRVQQADQFYNEQRNNLHRRESNSVTNISELTRRRMISFSFRETCASLFTKVCTSSNRSREAGVGRCAWAACQRTQCSRSPCKQLQNDLERFVFMMRLDAARTRQAVCAGIATAARRARVASKESRGRTLTLC